MRKFIFFTLMLLSQWAWASQEQAYRTRDYKHTVYFTAYQGKNMTRKALGGTAVAMRKCKMVDRLSFIKNEKLAYDANISGAFYCAHPSGLRAYVIVKRFKKQSKEKL
jgi:hypothetical protein